MTTQSMGTASSRGFVSCAYVLLTLSSFLLVSSWIRSGVPWTQALDVRAKLQAFAESKDEYDAVYVGASDVFRAFRPEVIDPDRLPERGVCRDAGSAFRSYNLGIPGMWSFEADHLLDEIIAMEPARLSWVLGQWAHLEGRSLQRHQKYQRADDPLAYPGPDRAGPAVDLAREPPPR